LCNSLGIETAQKLVFELVFVKANVPEGGTARQQEVGPARLEAVGNLSELER